MIFYKVYSINVNNPSTNLWKLWGDTFPSSKYNSGTFFYIFINIKSFKKFMFLQVLCFVFILISRKEKI